MTSFSLCARVCGVFLCALFLFASSGARAISSLPFPVRIGVLADAQITSMKGKFNYGMQSKQADHFSGVAIRTVAQEYLAPLMLERMLKELEKERVDLILFLGDGANSGCKDELETVFRLLAESRERSGIPSYFVIGNHDYLGTGNQVKLQVRALQCDRGGQDNPAQTKVQLIERVINHNTQSAAIDKGFAYSGHMVQAADPGRCTGDDLGQLTTYYVASLLGKTEATKPVQLLLVDTSDYRDVTFKANLSLKQCEGIGGWGTKGSMSFRGIGKQDPQIGTLVKFAVPGTQYRLLASHYSPLHFNAVYPWAISPSLVKDELEKLLSDGENIWLTAHTHTPRPKIELYPVGKRWSGKKGDFTGINVGSTTDYNSHALIIEAKDANNIGAPTMSLGYKLIEHPIVAPACRNVLQAARAAEGNLAAQCGWQSYQANLGLDKSYRKQCFNEEVRARIRQNIDDFSNNYAAASGTADEDVKACLAYASSAIEHLGKLPDDLQP